MKPVTIVGLGLAPRDLTAHHQKLIGKADILMGGKRHLSYFKDLPVKKKEIGKDIKGAIDYIQSRMQNRRLVVLASGDPLFFGIGALIVRALEPRQVAVYPNVSAVSAAFARIKEPWSRAKVVSLHGRDQTHALAKALKAGRVVAVFTDPVKNPAWLAAWLTDHQLDNYNLCVLEKMGTPAEAVRWYRPDEAIFRNFEEPNVVILKPAKDSQPQHLPIYLGLPEEMFDHEKGLITKSEIRAVTLSKLRLQPMHVLWDLGGGSGSISIEASALLSRGRVYCVEKNEKRIEHIRSNARRFAALNLEVIQAELPQGLGDLLPPDRIFIGGGGRMLPDIVKAAAGLLKPGGIVVINTVLLHNLHAALNALRSMGLQSEAIQVQIHRSRPMPWSERFEPQNPVWIVTGGHDFQESEQTSPAPTN